jgi:peptidoglycan-associated lipoprotein
MKMIKLIYPLAFALAFTLATTGCHNHKPVGITPLSGSAQTGVSDINPNTVQNGNSINPDTNPQTTQIATTDGSLFDNMIEDRAALAAYTVHFSYDSAVIKSSEQSNLDAVAAALKSDPNTKLLIEGHCDERGAEEYNRSLGERRALAAREALAKDGIDPSRVRTISYGKDRPADPGHDESAWAKNRRDEFVVLHPKVGVGA